MQRKVHTSPLHCSSACNGWCDDTYTKRLCTRRGQSGCRQVCSLKNTPVHTYIYTHTHTHTHRIRLSIHPSTALTCVTFRLSFSISFTSSPQRARQQPYYPNPTQPLPFSLSHTHPPYLFPIDVFGCLPFYCHGFRFFHIAPSSPTPPHPVSVCFGDTYRVTSLSAVLLICLRPTSPPPFPLTHAHTITIPPPSLHLYFFSSLYSIFIAFNARGRM